MTRPIATVTLAALLSAVACSTPPERPRCAECGMLADADPRFAAGATKGSDELRFDTPKCLFRYIGSSRGAGARDAWVTSYYEQRRVPTERAVYVVGSDVRGPMGRDVIPLEDTTAAAQFVEDHGGRVIELDAIDAKLLEELL